MRTLDEIGRLLAQAEEELARLNSRRAELLGQIADLQRERASFSSGDTPPQPSRLLLVSNQSPQEAKIALFRSLFRGREDVYPKRFESLKTGKQGYQPVCRNEWAAGTCEKPRMRCDDCPHREFLPITDMVVRDHLLGMDPQDRSGRDFTIGIYPMLPDEMCGSWQPTLTKLPGRKMWRRSWRRAGFSTCRRRWVEVLLYSHPAISRRVAMAREFSFET